MGAYIYAIQKVVHHPYYDEVGILKFLYKPSYSNPELQKRLKKLEAPILRKWKDKEVPCYVSFSEDLSEIFHYYSSSPLWNDSDEHKILEIKQQYRFDTAEK